MCLARVTESYAQPSELIVDAWKSFAGSSSAPKFQQFGDTVELDKWMQASAANAPRGITADDNKNYMPGFHVYAEEKEVKGKSGYRRVYVRRVTCAGVQGLMKCVVAQEMYVPSNQDGWPPLDPAEPPKPTVGSVPGPKKKLMERIKKAAGGKP
jgi:hypothetical protein